MPVNLVSTVDKYNVREDEDDNKLKEKVNMEPKGFYRLILLLVRHNFPR